MNKWTLLIIFVFLGVVGDMLHHENISMKNVAAVPPHHPLYQMKSIKTAKAEPVKNEVPTAKRKTAQAQEVFPQTLTEEPTLLTPDIQAKSYTVEEYKRRNPDKTGGVANPAVKQVPPTAIIIEANSKFPNEKTIPQSQLSADGCPDLKALEFPVTLRVNGNGYVVEAVSLFPMFSQSDIPRSILNCKIDGGGNEPFVTTFDPLPPGEP